MRSQRTLRRGIFLLLRFGGHGSDELYNLFQFLFIPTPNFSNNFFYQSCSAILSGRLGERKLWLYIQALCWFISELWWERHQKKRHNDISPSLGGAAVLVWAGANGEAGSNTVDEEEDLGAMMV